MAASAKMSFNYYQNGKYGTLPANPQKDTEITQDMHLKMSKKIAQLTKVIYALNTKNDEHDAMVQGLKEQHEEEMQRVLVETKEKISVFKQKIDEETDYRKRITSLEISLAEHEKHKNDAMIRFETFKRQAEERECRLKTEHSQKFLSLSQDVLIAKKDFENKLQEFEEWKQNVDSEKEKALADLEKAHKEEMDNLRQFQRTQNSDWLNECAKIEDKFKDQIEQLKTQCENLSEEKTKLAEDYELKLSKAQAFYEKELAALKHSQNELSESVSRASQEEHEKLKKDFAAQERELKKQIESLVNQLSLSEETVEKLKSELEQLKSVLQDQDTTSSTLNKLLQEAKNEANQAVTKLKEVESDLITTKQRCEEQAGDLLKKSSLIGELEATKLQQKSVIKEQESEIEKLKDRLAWLESERESLAQEKDSVSQEKSSQLRSLERSLEDLSLEKQTLTARFEREIQSLKDKLVQQEKDMTNKHATKIQELTKSHTQALQLQQEKADLRLSDTKQKLVQQHDENISRLTAEREAQVKEYDRIQTELSSKLSISEAEVRRLEALVKDSETGLGSASTKINSLKDAHSRMQSELEKTREELKTHKNNAATYKTELDKLKLLHENKMQEARVELKTKLDQLSRDLEEKWSENLRNECASLRRDLNQQKEDENRAALQHLAKLKDEEIAAVKRGWEGKVAELQRQIEKIKANLLDKEGQASEEMEKLRQEALMEKRRLEEELYNAGREYAQKIATMEDFHKEKMSKLSAQKDQELEELERKLKADHLEDMQGHMSAHKVAIESVKSEAEKDRLIALKNAREEHIKETEQLKEDIFVRHQSEIEELNRGHRGQLDAARMELDRAVEISKSKDRDHTMQVEELKQEITAREMHINNLKDEMKNLQQSINKITKELDQKGKEILKIRSDANLQLKKKEEVLLQKFQHELECVKSDHQQEQQALMEDFNEAQELMKDKISELQVLLEEAEEKYKNRDSRPEDLEMIHQLRDAIQEREMRVKQLIEEKKFFQMELVNRETNFNKVFNTDPKVGVLNPLHQKKNKKGDNKLSQIPSKHTSAPNLNASHRLDPLPNSPVHNSNLNPSKPLPLPAFTKKFIK